MQVPSLGAANVIPGDSVLKSNVHCTNVSNAIFGEDINLESNELVEKNINA
jgi:hypothetical protein